MAQNNHRKLLGYLLVQRVVLFLAFYEYLRMLYSITTNGPQGGLQNLSYSYDSAGNIGTITDLLDGNRTQTFTYDDLNRLRTSVSSSYVATLGTNTISYEYNQIGNMTLNTRVSSTLYAYHPTKPHAVIQAGSNTYQYDANGNMNLRNGVAIIYDYDNRVTNIGSVTSVYDYAGHRVKKNGTVYIGKLYECNGSSCTKYIFAGSSRIASQSSNKTYFYHTDHLGSSGVITDEWGHMAQETYYYPFGETRYNNGNATHYKFTGQEEDAETGLYYYGARYYDPAIGRFISADSIVQAPFNPQTLNRYGYCLNNPLLYVDPSGNFFLIDDILIGAAIGAFLGGTTSAITGGNVLQGMLLGAVSGAVFAGVSGLVSQGIYAINVPGGIGPVTSSSWLSAAQIGGDIAGGAAAGATSAAMSGSDIGRGALVGGISGGLGSFGSPNFEPFGSSATNELASMGNRLFNSAVTGAVFGGTYAGLTGGNIGHGAAMGAMGWAAGEAANMLIGRTLGSVMSEGREFRNGITYYYAEGRTPFALGGVVIGDINRIWEVDSLGRYITNEHEISHTQGKQRSLGPGYIPVHILSQGFSALISGFTSLHKYNIFEKSWIEVPVP